MSILNNQNICIKGAIFDLDGTLLDSMSVWSTMGSDYLRGRGIQPEEGLDSKFSSMSIAQAAQYYIDNYHLPESTDEIIMDIDRTIEQFYFEQARLKPGVKAFLQALQEKGTVMCVATATDRHLAHAALKRNGISQYFKDIFTCNIVGAGKDEPLIYETALACLGTEKSNTIIFEDAPHALATAKKAGFITACVYDEVFSDSWTKMSQLSDYAIKNFNRAI